MTDSLDATTARDSAGTSFWRRRRTMLIIVAGLVLAVALSILFGSSKETTDTDLDPQNPDPNGAQALAQVLGDEGVEVDIVRSLEELEGVEVTGQTSVVVTDSQYLGETAIEGLTAHVGRSPIVIVDPPFHRLGDLGFGEPQPVDSTDGIDADCSGPFDGLTLETDAAVGYPGVGCFGEPPVVATIDNVTVLGAGELLTNDQILRADNAAIALRLLGRTDHLIWYVPAFEDMESDDAVGLTDLIPDWIAPGLWILGLTTVLLILWRGRRLGPLSAEPLPVSVKAIETTLSRGRIYHKSRDRAHAAEVLRTGTRDRIATRLNTGAHYDEDALITEVVRRTERARDDVAWLIGSRAATPGNDRDLLHLAKQLDELMREVRRT